MRSRPALAASWWMGDVRKWYYNATGFHKSGLMGDVTVYEDEHVKEAMRVS